MKFELIDTQAAYARLLDEPDRAAREAIFRAQVVAPFAGLAQRFGGSDPLAMFAQWGMSPDLFSGVQRAQTQAVVEGLAAADGWQRAAASLARAREAFAPYADRIPLQEVVFGLLVADLSRGSADTEGYTGFGGVPGYVMTVYGKASPFNLERIEACTVHELHHNVLSAVFPKNFMTETTVGDYMVMEGLAESFAGELYGAALLGPWTTRFDETRLPETKTVLAAHLKDTGFNTIRSYIFGDLPESAAYGLPNVGLPPYTGYAIGYRVVQAYLARRGGSVADATFVPAEQIIAESGYFD